MNDFTLDEYLRLASALRAHPGIVGGLDRWTREPPANGVLVRHDVDRNAGNALVMARLERDLGVCSTYYFRVVGSAFDPDVIATVSDLGHEVGYHYEDLSATRGDGPAAVRSFAANLAMMRRIAPIRTVAMHGSPLSRFNNLDLWQHTDLEQHGLSAEAFLTIDYAGAWYFTDTGRSWAGGNANLRDRPPTARSSPSSVRTTEQLISYVQSHPAEIIAISAHPERWTNERLPWARQLAKDRAANMMKRALRIVRSHR